MSSWSAHLPPAMQHYETSSIIRAPDPDSQRGGADNFVSRELSWAVDNRLLEMQTWLYQPFLYYLIHAKPFAAAADTSPQQQHLQHEAPFAVNPISSILNPYPSPHSQPVALPPSIPVLASLGPDDLAILRSLIVAGIDCNVKTLAVRCLRHRHHGLWFDLRSLMCAALVLLGVVRSGGASWIPGGGGEVLWGAGYRGAEDECIGGLVGTAIEQFEFWSEEAPDLKRHASVLRDVVRDVRAALG